jgi:hypothetical protein
MARLAILCVLVAVTATPHSTFGEDPLDRVDGTEDWDEIDTSSVDEARAWRQWRFDLSRWEAGRVRFDNERARMEHYHQRHGRGETLEEIAPDTSGQDHQARIDAARRVRQSGGADERDEEGQVIEDERPWSRR